MTSGFTGFSFASALAECPGEIRESRPLPKPPLLAAITLHPPVNHFVCQETVALCTGGPLVVIVDRHTVARCLRKADISRNNGFVDILIQLSFTFSTTCRERFVLASYMVKTTPSISSSGFRRSCTSSIVCISWDKPPVRNIHTESAPERCPRWSSR